MLLFKRAVFVVIYLSYAFCAIAQEFAGPKSTAGYITIDSAFLGQFFHKHGLPAAVREKTYAFYTRHNFKPVWFDRGKPIPQASLLVNTFRSHKMPGLVNDYGLGNLADSVSSLDEGLTFTKRSSSAGWFDVALTTTFFDFFPKMWSGQVDPTCR